VKKTFNKWGDQGETSLLFGQRVSKSSPRFEFYRTIDEAVSAMGLARAMTQKKECPGYYYEHPARIIYSSQ